MSGSEKLSASLEDYIEAIYNLSKEAAVVRSKDMAKLLNVSKASVTGALRALKDKKMINYQPYDFITLTDSGKTAAAEVAQKHSVLKSFFTDVLQISPEMAQQAACKAEHTLGPKVVYKLLCFTEFVSSENENGLDIVTKFAQFNRKHNSD